MCGSTYYEDGVTVEQTQSWMRSNDTGLFSKDSFFNILSQGSREGLGSVSWLQQKRPY